MKKKEYSSKKRKEIVRLYQEEKLSAEKIAEIHGCSEFPIRRFLRENNIPMRKSKTSVVSTDEINRLYKTGMDSVQIAKKFGLTTSAISIRIDRNIIRKRGPDPILSDLELIRLHSEEKKSIAFLSQKYYGVPFASNLRDRAIKLGCYSPTGKNPIKFHGGYAMVKIPEHPRANKKGYVQQHYVVMENKLRRDLVYDKQKQDGEIVHHIDGNKIHNAPSNLVLCKSNLEHRQIHAQLDSTLSKLVKSGKIAFDLVQRGYYLNYENPRPPKKRKINPKAVKHKSHSYYLKINKPDHHRADERGRVLEHIIIAEKKEGRKIYATQPIHHIDLDTLNNWPENLLVCKNAKEHNQLIKNQLHSLVIDLMDNKKLFFNKETKQYYTEKK